MENHVDTSVQELTTEAMQDVDTMGQEPMTSAEDLSLNPRVIEILGAQATSTGMTKKALLEMLILRAEHVVSWDQQTADALGVLANHAGLSRQEFLECLLLRTERVMTWQPPKLRVRPWWRFWEQPEWEEPEPVFPAVMESFMPQLPPARQHFSARRRASPNSPHQL